VKLTGQIVDDVGIMLLNLPDDSSLQWGMGKGLLPAHLV